MVDDNWIWDGYFVGIHNNDSNHVCVGGAECMLGCFGFHNIYLNTSVEVHRFAQEKGGRLDSNPNLAKATGGYF